MVMFRYFMANLIRGHNSQTLNQMKALKKIDGKKPSMWASKWKVSRFLSANSKDAQRQMLEHQMLIYEELKKQNVNRVSISDRVAQRRSELKQIRERQEKGRVINQLKDQELER